MINGFTIMVGAEADDDDTASKDAICDGLDF
jgi:hypothetical protein